MVFSSLIFIFLFLPIVLVLYYLSPTVTLKNWLLVIASVIFYAWGEPFWVILLLASATVDYWNGRLIERYRGTPWAKLALFNTFAFNIGCLAMFKYSGFFVENINAIAPFNLPVPNFALPVGISFYVFMSISYTIDVWRGEVKAQRNFGSFLVYIANFHHLVAGPIIRYGHIAKEIQERYFHWQDLSYGIVRFCRGLFKKVFIANTAGALAEPLLHADPATATVAGVWLGVVFFALQIYFDFSGYSDMAIGLGRMFGFKYHENFDHPYAAKSITDFWRRWHISLGNFFRDYVYIPMGGNRVGQLAQIRNIMFVWMLTGFWHGASWNFIFWGLYFGGILLMEKLLLRNFLPKLPSVIQHSYALFLIIVGWAIFYYTDLGLMWQSLQIMFGAGDVPLWGYVEWSVLKSNAYWFIFACLLCFPIYHKAKNALIRYSSPAVVVSVDWLMSAVFLLVCVALLVGSTYNPFIYFRF